MPDAQALADAVIATFEGTQPEGVVLATAVVDDDGGAFAASAPDGLDGVFEFGSISKAITGTLLGALVVRGDVSLDSALGKWLDAGGNASITLLELATHTSGLPRLAPNAFDHEGFDRANPYARFSPHLAEKALREVALSARGSSVYSNFGFQLLGLALERASSTPYGDLLATELFVPIGLRSAQLRSGSGLDGHDKSGSVVPHWEQQLPGSGGVEGTIADLAALARAVLTPPGGRAGEAMTLATGSHFVKSEREVMGLGWATIDGHYVFHNGGTSGFSSSVVIDTTARRAVASLASVGDLTDALDSAGFHAVAGMDPSPARPEPLSTEPADAKFAEAAKAFADALFASNFSGAENALAPKVAAAVSAERLGEVWGRSLETYGPLTDAGDPVAHRRPFGAAVRLDLKFERGALALHTAHDESTDIIGVLLIGPDDAAPF